MKKPSTIRKSQRKHQIEGSSTQSTGVNRAKRPFKRLKLLKKERLESIKNKIE